MEKLRKGDIYNVNLKGLNNQDYKVRPCIIFNSNRSLMKNKLSYTILPLTSNIDKVLKQNIVIEGFGLHLKSKVLTQRITTIDSDRLLEKVGHISDLKIMKKINDCVSDYLDLKRSDKVEVGDLLNMLYNENEDLEVIKKDLYDNYLKSNFVKAGELANKLISKSRGRNDEFIWLGFYTKSLIDLQLDNRNLENIDQAMQYVSIDNKTNFRYTLWCFANLAEKEDVNKSIEIFKELSDSYKSTGNKIERISCLWNICKLKNDRKKMEVLLTMCKQIEIWSYLTSKDIFIENLEIELKQLDVNSI